MALDQVAEPEAKDFMPLGAALARAERCRSEGRLGEAEALCRRVLEAQPNSAEAEHLLGMIAHQNGRLGEAINHVQRAAQLAPQVALYHANLGEMFRLAGRRNLAIEEARRALAIEPAMPMALTNLGITFYELENFDEAIRTHRQAIAADPNFPDAHSNLGNALHALRRYDEAIEAYRRALELRPNFADAWANLGTTLHHAGEFEEGAVALRRAMALAPGHANARSGLSILLLMRGEFAEGWEEYEWRLRSSEQKGPLFPEKPWQGESLAGKHIYVQAEQGIGDTIQFARYLPLLAARGAKVTARVQQPLVRLLGGSLADIEVVGNRDGAVSYDCDAALLSLPRLFKTRFESIPAHTPYLRASSEATRYWKTRLAKMEGFKVGVAWAGNPKHANDARRSLPASMLAPLFAVPGTQFASLQVGPRTADLDNLKNLVPAIDDLSPELNDFAETAGAIAALDLVVTVDTSVAHLAGALGKPVWVLVPWVTDWRWMFEREDCSWYPTMRLFRHERGAAWADVIARMAPLLQAAANGSVTELMPFRAAGEQRAARAAAIIAADAERFEPILSSRAGPARPSQNSRSARHPNSRADAAALSPNRSPPRPDSAEAAHIRGIVAHKKGKGSEAIEHVKRAVRLAPEVAQFHADLGEMLRLAGHPDQAVDQARYALAIEPGSATALSNLGVALYDTGNFEEALRTHQRVIAANPDFAEAHSNFGNALHALWRFDEAAAAYRQAIELKPDFAQGWSNLANALHDAGDFEAALAAMRRAIALAPNARSGLGTLLLRRGDFAEGWEEYEWRLHAAQQKGSRFPVKPWRGESLAGKHIYIKAEQGLGDTIHFARYLPLLAARAGQVTARVQDSLIGLLRQNLSGVNVIGNREGPVSYDYDAALLSLPRLLKTRRETIPAHIPYLRASPEAARHWKARLAQTQGLKIGVAWAGNPQQPNDVRRSLPASVLAPLFAVPGTRFASLQVGPRAADLSIFKDHPAAILDLSQELSDFSATAAAIAALDLVIAVDTSVAHLAGALGKPVWVPTAWIACWRWMLQREDSPWYPTMRLFRQQPGEGWAEVIARIAPQLQAVANGDTAPLTPFKAEGERRAADASAIIAIEAARAAASGDARPQRVNPGRALMLAEQKRRRGFLADADELTRRAVSAAPDNAEAAHMLGIVAHQSGKLAEAIEHIRRAIAIDANVALYHSNLGEMCRLAGRLEEALAAGRRALEINPDYPDALNNVGIALFDHGKFEEALAHYERAITLRPDFAQSHSNRGNALLRLKRFSEAEKNYRRATELQPDFADGWNNLGTCLRELKRPADAEAAYRRALELAPDNPDTLDNLALALKDLERLDEALQALRRALTLQSRGDKLHVHSGTILLDQEKIDEAAAAAERAIAINANNYDAVNLMGRIAFKRGELHAAIDHYRRALELKPDLADAYNNMGNALKELGKLTEAQEAYFQAIRIEPDRTSIYYNLADAKKFTPADPYLAAMEGFAAKTEGLSNNERMELDFALGKAYTDLKDYSRSFAHLFSGNAAKRATISYREDLVLALFDRIEAGFTAELIAAKTGGGDTSSMPIFVLGMPRSGTTLVEQIISSHPLVYGAGELRNFNEVVLTIKGADGNTISYPEFVPILNEAALKQIGARYIASLRQLLPSSLAGGISGAKQFVTDKMPSNYYFIGLIHLALPNAKIIHTVRDPVDTCLSCFSKLFAAEQNHTYDLGEIGRYHKRYQRLMEHWQSVLPAGRILDVRYEEVVADLEKEARRIIAHCGLPWDDRCLSFYENDRPVRTASASQVRQPIYSSAVGRWRMYQEHLGTLLTALDVAAH